MKKLFATVLALVLMLSVTACTVTETPADTKTTAGTGAASGTGKIEISLWTFPIGNWGDEKTVNTLLASFNEKYPNIKVNVQYLAYSDGDDKVNAAIEGGTAPDIIMEGPERLVANWGAKGLMVDLADLWTADSKADISANNPVVTAACQWTDGAYYAYPLCMTAHCMAINKTVFEAAGAMRYIDEENHTWTTEDFFQAVDAVYRYTGKPVGAVYCAGQAGDQGTRALVNNLYGGTFTNAGHTAYTLDSEENIKALEELAACEGIIFDASIDANGEIPLFRNGTLQMSFCWNIGQQLKSDTAPAGFTDNGDEILFMSFPSDDGAAELCGGIWGFGIFDNGSDAKIAAAKTLVRYLCDENTADAVKASTYFPVKASVSEVYAGEQIEPVMREYTKLMGSLGDYYNVVPGWTQARVEWWNMLQRIGAGGDAATQAQAFTASANAAAAAG